MRYFKSWRPLAPAVILAATSPFLLQVAAQDNGLPTLGGSTENNNGLPTATSGDKSAAASTAAASSAAATSDSKDDGPPTLTESKPQTTTLGEKSSSDGGAMPTIADPSSEDSGGLPTLAGGFNYPPPTVPPTAGAPYMQKSNLPEGTVFICVGAAIGFIALVILAWRMLVAWSINRSVKRAALASSYSHHTSDTKALLPPPPNDHHRRRHRRKSTHAYESSNQPISEKHLSRGSPTPRLPSQTPNPSSLFFSPTAGTGMHSNSSNAPVPGPMNRASATYLPPGYYNASTGTRPKSSRSPINNDPSNISPPDSPSVLTSSNPAASSVAGTMGPAGDSSSTINLMGANSSASVSGGRAPSTYLDEMMNAPPPVPRHQGQLRERQEELRANAAAATKKSAPVPGEQTRGEGGRRSRYQD